MKTLVLASRNPGKAAEMRELVNDLRLGITVYSLADFLVAPDVDEVGQTFLENALAKARSACLVTGLTALGDDSGLEVEYLGGAPGVYSARFAGEPRDDGANNHKLLRLLTGVPQGKRGARFCCALALVLPDGREYAVEGDLPGWIVFCPRGTKGFGYDPLFQVPQYGLTMAELDPDIKNSISHRARAFERLTPLLHEVFAG